MSQALEVSNLVKVYPGGVRALKGVSFSVEEGEVFGLLGPNGAGKTTTLRIVATLLKPSSGEVRVFGVDAVRRPDEVRRMIGYLPEEAGAYKNLTGYEFLRFIAELRGGDVEEMIRRAERICGLGGRLRDKTKTYSKGMLRRLLVASVLMFRPKLALLDEPTGGVDVLHALHIRRAIRELVGEGVTVVISSHNMLEVEHLCDRVAILHQGRIAVQGSPEELKDRYGAENLEEVFARVVNCG